MITAKKYFLYHACVKDGKNENINIKKKFIKFENLGAIFNFWEVF